MPTGGIKIALLQGDLDSNIKLITPEFSRMFVIDLLVGFPCQSIEAGVVVSVNAVALDDPGKGVPELF